MAPERGRFTERLGAFFMVAPFSTGGEPSTDQPDLVSALDMRDDQYPASIRSSNEDETLLTNRVLWIGNRE
ncbi:MAG: hypothetical protein ACRET7_00415 [Burkholderiales bacterium]